MPCPEMLSCSFAIFEEEVVVVIPARIPLKAIRKACRHNEILVNDT